MAFSKDEYAKVKATVRFMEGVDFINDKALNVQLFVFKEKQWE